MKTILYTGFLCIASLSFSLSGNDTVGLYVKCLKIHIEKSNKEENSGHSSPDTVNIISNGLVGLPDSIGKYKLRIIDDTILSLISNSSIHAIKLFPIKIENSNLIITLGNYIISKGSSGLIFAYGGGISFYFRYDCSKKEYIFLRSEVLSF